VTHSCPVQSIGNILNAIPLFDLFAKGAMPVSGGVLDQSAWFIQAEQFFSNDVESTKAEAMRRDH
jgi:hypothetical protein